MTLDTKFVWKQILPHFCLQNGGEPSRPLTFETAIYHDEEKHVFLHELSLVSEIKNVCI